jgi:acyl carrier protein
LIFRARKGTLASSMLEERLKKVFASALGLGPGVDPTSLAYAQNPVWDSVAHMQLIGALESEFDIMLETDDVIGLSSFHEAERIVRKYGAA